MARKVIEIERTPNPNAMKFNLDGLISEETRSFLRAEDTAGSGGSGLASSLFAIGGVSGVMFCRDFVTVNKEADVKWSSLKMKVVKLLEKEDEESEEE